jgi:hypothetical protein
VHVALLHYICLDLVNPFPLLRNFDIFPVAFPPTDHHFVWTRFLSQVCLETVFFPSFPAVVVGDQAEDAVVELCTNFETLVVCRRAGRCFVVGYLPERTRVEAQIVVAAVVAGDVKFFARSANGGADFGNPVAALLGVVSEVGRWDDIEWEGFAGLQNRVR